MTRIDFFSLLSENIGLYILLLIFIFLVMIQVIRKSCNSVMNPVFFPVLTSIFANVIPFFLFFTNQISKSYLFYFIIAEFVFWYSFITAFKNWDTPHRRLKVNSDYSKSSILYILFSLIFICFFLIQLKYFGFGLFSIDRLGVFKESGGFGIISRLNGFICTYCLFYCIYIWDLKTSHNKYLRLYSIPVTALALGNLLLSGSKSALFQIMFIYFFYYFITYKKLPSKKTTILLFSIGIVSSLIIITLRISSDNIYNAILPFVERIVVNGDGYWYAYPNETIEHIKPAAWYIDLFRPFIYGLRIASYSEATPAVGTQLVYEIMPHNIGLAIGANSRPTLWGYAMFGSFGIFFSLVWGIILGFLCKLCFTKFPKGLIGTFSAYMILSCCLAGISDPQLTFLFLFDTAIGFSLMMTVLLIYELAISSKKNALR